MKTLFDSMTLVFQYQALYDGLVAHYELGQLVNMSCVGTDHGGDDWVFTQDQEVSGTYSETCELKHTSK